MVELKIEGMNCMHCVKSVTAALARVAGVTEVQAVRLDDGTARVAGTADPAALVAAVQDAGYMAQVLG